MTTWRSQGLRTAFRGVAFSWLGREGCVWKIRPKRSLPQSNAIGQQSVPAPCSAARKRAALRRAPRNEIFDSERFSSSQLYRIQCHIVILI